jgi:hypothetical protein
MSNITVVSDIASAKMVEALIADPDSLLKTVDKSYSADFEQKTFSPSGGTIQIPVADQPQMAAQQVAVRNDPLNMRQVPLTYANYNTSLEIGAINETFDAGKAVMTQTNKDRMKALAATMAQIGYNQLYTTGGFLSSIAAGTALTTSTQIGAFRAALVNQYALDGIYMAGGPEDINGLAGAVATAFNPTNVSTDAYLEGVVNKVASVNLFESTLIPYHTNGSAAGTGAAGMYLSANITTGATSITVAGGTTTGTIKAGSILYMTGNGTTTGMNEVNPLTRANIGTKYGMCVAADVTLSGGAGTITLTQAIYGPENPKLQNVSRLGTVDGTAAYVALYGLPDTTYRQVFFYRKQSALALVGLKRAELIMNQNGSADWDGIPIQTAASGDVQSLLNIYRIDFLGGACVKQYRHVKRAFTAAIT